MPTKQPVELSVWVMTELTEEELVMRIMKGINIGGEEHGIGISPIWQTTKRECINFAEFIKTERWHYDSEKLDWYQGIFQEKRTTTEQLYELFQQSLKK